MAWHRKGAEGAEGAEEAGSCKSIEEEFMSAEVAGAEWTWNWMNNSSTMPCRPCCR